MLSASKNKACVKSLFTNQLIFTIMANLRTLVNAYNNKADKKTKSCYYVGFKFYDLSGTHTDHEVYRETPFSQQEIAAEARRQMPNIMWRFGHDNQVITEVVEVCYPDQTQDSCDISNRLNKEATALIAAEWEKMNERK